MKLFSTIILGLVLAVSQAQTLTKECLTDGSFDSNSPLWVPTNSTQFGIRFGSTFCYSSALRCAANAANNDIDEFLSQTVSIPAYTSKITITFKVSITTTEDAGIGDYDILSYGMFDSINFYADEVSNDDGIRATSATTCTSYSTKTFTIESGNLINQCVQRNADFVLRVETDFEKPTVFRVDNASVIATVLS